MINRTKRNLKNKKGFTLIELVVVIAVIGILAAIAIPRVTGITSKARTSATEQHVAVLNSALERYKAETGDTDLVGDDSTLTKYKAASGQTVANLIDDLQRLNYLSKDVGTALPDNTKELHIETYNFIAKAKTN